MSKPPIVIVNDFRTHRPEDVPDAFVQALRDELTPVIEYEDMSPEAQRIVDAGNVDLKYCIKLPSGLTRDELIAWMKQQFGA
ncbi:MAG: hypothetical protein ABSC06_27200 [Rhodopila sp.]|jgi:hypothetical protein